MSKKAEEEVRYIYVRDEALTKTGFTSVESANAHADTLGPRDGETQRVRVRRRERTGMWDVVVKTRREQRPVDRKDDAPDPHAKDHGLVG